VSATTPLTNGALNLPVRFLHATLQLDALQECLSVYDAKVMLEKFPLDITEEYVNVWHRIRHASDKHTLIAKLVVLWVVCAPRPITVAQLRHAVATSQRTFEHERDGLVAEHLLIPLAYGLVKVDDKCRVVRLFREWFLRNNCRRTS
jgi:ankyrin repeat domain-containing protein 50